MTDIDESGYIMRTQDECLRYIPEQLLYSYNDDFNGKETAIDHIIQQINRFVKLFLENYSVISVKVISPSVLIFSPDEISNVYE